MAEKSTEIRDRTAGFKMHLAACDLGGGVVPIAA